MGTFFQWLIDLLREVKFWFRVEPWERAIRVRAWYKRNITNVAGPGLHWKIPMLDEVYMVNTRQRLGPTSTQTISTKDGKIVTLGITLGFSIVDPLQALSTYQHPENSVAVLVHNYAADYILSRELEEIIPSDLEDSVLDGLRASDPDNGITIEFVKITNFVFSSPARTIRLIQDDIITDFSSDASTRAKYQPNITQW